MPYSPLLVNPMRQELTSAGFEELMSAEDVERFMTEKSESAILVINSVCGCAAGQARPGVRLALESPTRPDHLATVFAGQEVEATALQAGDRVFPLAQVMMGVVIRFIAWQDE